MEDPAEPTLGWRGAWPVTLQLTKPENFTTFVILKIDLIET